MFDDINMATIEGNLVKDAYLKICKDGKTYSCLFTIGSNSSKKDQQGNWNQVASFFNVSCFVHVSDNILNYLLKGTKVIVTGSVSLNVYKDNQGQEKAGLKIEAKSVKQLFNYPKRENNQQQNTSYNQQNQRPAAQNNYSNNSFTQQPNNSFTAPQQTSSHNGYPKPASMQGSHLNGNQSYATPTPARDLFTAPQQPIQTKAPEDFDDDIPF